MKYKSIAVWPEGTCMDQYGRSQSEDTHLTREEAQGVCDMLNEHGFGGMGQAFPLMTAVQEVEE